MANTSSAKKAVRQTTKRTAQNRQRRSTLRTAIKKMRRVLEEGDARKAKDLLPQTLSVIDASKTKGIIHPNTAARHKSRLMLALRRLKKKT